MVNRDLSDKRIQYNAGALLEEEVADDPYVLFSKWYSEAEDSEIVEPHAFCLSTVGADLKPSSRIVLCKGFSRSEGFRFFTGYQSRKGEQLSANKSVSMLFYWDRLERQVRIEGETSKLSREETAKYFYSRPRDSQLSAYTSEQSSVVKNRKELEAKREESEKRLEGQEVPLPEHWGGYVVKPSYFEFWQGRPNRLHDRLYFSLEGDSWKTGRLQP